MKRVRQLGQALTAAVAASLFVATTAGAQTLTPTIFTDPHPLKSTGTIGFTYAGDMFVGSVQQDGTGALYATDLDGTNVRDFAPGVSLAASNASEHFLASSLGLGGFESRDIYAAAGSTVVHISHDGLTSSTFVSGLNGFVRGILFDAIGTFNGDMLITTTSGDVYRVTSAGTATLLASVGEDTEGLDIAPIGAGFGSFDGQLIVASEGSNTIRAINTLGSISTVLQDGGFGGAEELSFVPLDLGVSGDPVEGFYGANYTPNVIKIGSGQFAGMQGDVIVTGEGSGGISRVHWNGTSFLRTTEGSFPNQPEDGIFVTRAIVTGGVPEPGAIAFAVGGGSLGLMILRRRRK